MVTQRFRIQAAAVAWGQLHLAPIGGRSCRAYASKLREMRWIDARQQGWDGAVAEGDAAARKTI